MDVLPIHRGEIKPGKAKAVVPELLKMQLNNFKLIARAAGAVSIECDPREYGPYVASCESLVLKPSRSQLSVELPAGVFRVGGEYTERMQSHYPGSITDELHYFAKLHLYTDDPYEYSTNNLFLATYGPRGTSSALYDLEPKLTPIQAQSYFDTFIKTAAHDLDVELPYSNIIPLYH